ncbi:flagellar hook-basal body complex protein [Hydrogenimonas sp.]
MNRSFYNGVSGSKTYMTGMDTVANNIANVNTTGYKGKEAEFATIFSQTLDESSTLPTSSQVGLGSRINATSLNLDQGSLIGTDGMFDFAIAGDGWFAVKNGIETLYTRNGAFNTDAANYLVDENGSYLLGVSTHAFTPDPANPGTYKSLPFDNIALTSDATTEKIFLPSLATIPAKPTENVTFKANLNPSLKNGNVTLDIPPKSLTLTTDMSTETATISGDVVPSATILDPKPGDSVVITLSNIAGQKMQIATTLDNALHFQITDADISTLDPATQGPITATAKLLSQQPIPNIAHFQAPIIAGNGEKGFIDMTFTQHLPAPQVGTVWDAKAEVLQFEEPYDASKTYDPVQFLVDEKAKKVYKRLDVQTGSLTFDATGALLQNTIPPLSSGGATLQLHLGTPYDPANPNSGYDGLTTFTNLPTASHAETHDGYEKGDLRGYSAADDGTIYANFSNGKSSAVARIPIYHFINDQGLGSEGGVYFSSTSNSGKAFMYTDSSGDVIQGAKLHSFALESSNVSLNHALTEMIMMQKAFDANAKSITTSDQMIQKAINMKK